MSPGGKDEDRRGEERKGLFTTSWGTPLARVSRSDDAAIEYARDLGEPGEFPYTRGVQPTMYRGRLWTMRQYAGFGSAEETNRRYRYLLEQGQTGLSVAFDLPTQMGYDADAPTAYGEVGKVGVSISSVDDLAALLDGIPLDRVSTSMTINATAAILLAMYIAVAKKQGVSPRVINGTVQNDILKEYIARGLYIYPPRFSLRLVTDVFGYCQQNVPNWNTISISGYHIREAGSTAVQELAFTFGNAMTYVQAALDAIRLGADHERTKIALNKSGNRRTSFADGVGIAEPSRPGRVAKPHGDELKFADIAMGAVR